MKVLQHMGRKQKKILLPIRQVNKVMTVLQ